MIVAPAEPAKPKPQPVLRLKEPVAGRVYQRDANGKADIPIVLDETEGVKDTRIGATFASAHVSPQPRFEDGKLIGVPTGGPYSILTQARHSPSRARRRTSSSATSGFSPDNRTWKDMAI